MVCPLEFGATGGGSLCRILKQRTVRVYTHHRGQQKRIVLLCDINTLVGGLFLVLNNSPPLGAVNSSHVLREPEKVSSYTGIYV